jgi:uncharacterized membrane protein YhaH (DUF805 family)
MDINNLNFLFIFDVLNYISRSPYFWQSLGMLIATAMFIGALLYNGDLSLTIKGVVTIVAYAFFLILIFSTRVVSLARVHDFSVSQNIQAHAGIFTIFVLTLAYIFGLYVGVFIVKFAHRGVK